jgi:hypothetical protein
MAQLDADGSGNIGFHEFLSATQDLNILANEEVLHMAFARLDRDGSGTLRAGEVQQVGRLLSCWCQLQRLAGMVSVLLGPQGSSSYPVISCHWLCLVLCCATGFLDVRI